MLSIILQFGLFIWYILSLYFVGTDTTISPQLMITGEIINLLCLGYILSNIKGQNNDILFSWIGIILLAWYIYYTPLDIIHQGYSPIEKITYVAIDFSTLIYLMLSLTLAFFKKYASYFSLCYQVNKFKTIGFSWI